MTRYEKVQKELAYKQYTWLVTGEASFIGSNLVEKVNLSKPAYGGMGKAQAGFQHNPEQAVENGNQAASEDRSTPFNFTEGDIRIPEGVPKGNDFGE